MDDYRSIMRRELSKDVENWNQVVDEVGDRIVEYLAQARFGTDTRGQAIRHVVHQAGNTFLDVLTSASSGAGRESLMGARVLFDLLVTLLDVASDPQMAERYVDHQKVVIHQLSSLDIHMSVLKGKDLQSAKHHMKRAHRESKADYEAVIAKYGSQFLRSWHPKNLFDRAKVHGLDHFYEFYRVASPLQHGAVGGSIGTYRVVDEVHRIGPAVALTPFALLYAIEFATRVFRGASPLGGTKDASTALRALSELRDRWTQFSEATYALDARIWPAQTPAGFIAVAALGVGGIRWFVHDTENDLVAEADPPTGTSREQVQAIHDLFEKLRPTLHQVEVTGPLGVLTVAVFEVTVTRKARARWKPASTLMASGYGARPTYTQREMEDLVDTMNPEGPEPDS